MEGPSGDLSAVPKGIVKALTEKINRPVGEETSDAYGRKPPKSTSAKGHETDVKKMPNRNSKADNTDGYGSTHLSGARETEKVTDIATESQLLEDLQRYTHRPFDLEKCLNSLCRLTQNLDSARKDIIELILPGMEEHRGLLGIQMPATACLYNLTKGDLVKKIHPSILKQVVELTLKAMEDFPNDYQLQKNSLHILYSERVLQDVEFDKYRCARLVLNCLCTFDDPSMDEMNIAICRILAQQISITEKLLLESQPQYLRKLLSIVKSKVQASCVDDTMKFMLGVLVSLIDETPTTCSVILEEGGLDLFLKVLVTFQDECEVATYVLNIISNMAGVPQVCECLILPEFMTRFRKLLHSDHINLSYFAANIIAHLASDGAETCVVDVMTRQELLKELGEVVINWEKQDVQVDVAHRSFQSFFPLLTCHEAFQVQLWAVWAIQHACTKNAKRYCPMLIEEGGREMLQQLHDSFQVNPTVRNICWNILDVLAAVRPK